MSRSLSSMSQADRLEKAFSKTGVGRREIAQIMRGKDATKGQIAATKSQIVKWLGGDGISDENAERLSSAFNQATGSLRFKPDHFKKPPGPRTWAEAMRELAKEKRENERLRAEIARLRRAS